MKFSKSQIFSRVHSIPEIRFEDQRLTSFAGLVIIQALFVKLDMKSRLQSCFEHMPLSPIFGHHTIVLMLIVHLMLVYRRLRDMDHYRDDLMVLRLLGLRKFPDVSTVSRALVKVDEKSIIKIPQACREMMLTRLQALRLVRVTLDFDDSVLTTGRLAEDTAVAFNKQKKGQRSYYPLFSTIA